MNERLRQILNLKEQRLPEGESELADKTTKQFDLLVDFLRDSNHFPNAEINKLVTLLWKLIGNHHVDTALDLGSIITSISFVVESSRVHEHPLVILPKDFISEVQLDPVMQLGGLVFMASQARDYWTGRLIHERNTPMAEAFRHRAYAFEADMLNTVEKMLESTGEKIELNDYHQQVKEKFPQGLGSLSSFLSYPTTPYRTIGMG